MRALAEAWPDEAIVQAPLAQLTWFHNLTLLEKLKSRDDRLWYARAAIENGWSRNVLVIQIEAGLPGGFPPEARMGWIPDVRPADPLAGGELSRVLVRTSEAVGQPPAARLRETCCEELAGTFRRDRCNWQWSLPEGLDQVDVAICGIRLREVESLLIRGQAKAPCQLMGETMQEQRGLSAERPEVQTE